MSYWYDEDTAGVRYVFHDRLSGEEAQPDFYFLDRPTLGLRTAVSPPRSLVGFVFPPTYGVSYDTVEDVADLVVPVSATNRKRRSERSAWATGEYMSNVPGSVVRVSSCVLITPGSPCPRQNPSRCRVALKVNENASSVVCRPEGDQHHGQQEAASGGHRVAAGVETGKIFTSSRIVLVRYPTVSRAPASPHPLAMKQEGSQKKSRPRYSGVLL